MLLNEAFQHTAYDTLATLLGLFNRISLYLVYLVFSLLMDPRYPSDGSGGGIAYTYSYIFCTKWVMCGLCQAADSASSLVILCQFRQILIGPVIPDIGKGM